MTYDHAEIEPRWQRYWDEHATFRAERRHAAGPSATSSTCSRTRRASGLHVGHPEGYTATDIVARYGACAASTCCTRWAGTRSACPPSSTPSRPARTRARRRAKNIATFKRQLKMLGFSYDWSREIDTTDPGYVTLDAVDLPQALRARASRTRRDPRQLVPRARHGARQRGGHRRQERARRPPGRAPAAAPVDAQDHRVRRPARRRPRRARLARDEGQAAPLDRPSEGAEIDFAVDGHPDARIRVFTTRADTLPGATYVVLAPEHPLVAQARDAGRARGGRAYVEAAAPQERPRPHRSAKTKTGVPPGAFAIHPINGERAAHLGRRLRHRHLRHRRGHGRARRTTSATTRSRARTGCPSSRSCARTGDCTTRSRPRTPTTASTSAAARSTACATPAGQGARSSAWLADARARPRHGHLPAARLGLLAAALLGRADPHLLPGRARDPTAIRGEGRAHTIHYDQPIAVDESELPLRLPELEDFRPGDDPAGPLARVGDWRFFQKDGSWYARETNTMPQWAGSCWYYLRFLDPHERRRALVDARRTTTGCPSTSTSAAPSTPCCTCSTRASGTRCSSTSAS